MTTTISSREKARLEGRRGRTGLSDRSLAFVLVIPAALLILVFAVYPFFMAVWNSFNEVNIATGVGSFNGIANYLAIFSKPAVLAAQWRSVVWTVFNIVLQVGIGVMVAMLLNANLKGQAFMRGLVLFPYMVPAIVVAMIFQFMFNDVTGVINYALRTVGLISEPIAFLSDPRMLLWTAIVVNVWKYSPFFMIIVLARLQTIPHDLYESVAVDGGGAWRKFIHVTLPGIIPVLLAGMMLRTIWTAYDFDLPFLLSNGGGPEQAAVTVPLAIRSLAFESNNIGQASALAVVTAVVLTGAAYLYMRTYGRAEKADR